MLDIIGVAIAEEAVSEVLELSRLFSYLNPTSVRRILFAVSFLASQALVNVVLPAIRRCVCMLLLGWYRLLFSFLSGLPTTSPSLPGAAL
jgi:hypothetical protein